MITRLMLNLRDPALATAARVSARTGTGFSTTQNLSTLVDPDNEVEFTEGHGRRELDGDIELSVMSHPGPPPHILAPPC